MGEVTRTRRYLIIAFVSSLVIVLIARLVLVECSDYIQLPHPYFGALFILAIIAIWTAAATIITLVVLFILKKLPSFKHLK